MIENCFSLLTVVQPPTGVAVMPTGKTSARVTWNPVNKILIYQVNVTNTGHPSNDLVIQTTSTTYMDINNLEPCSTFIVGVSSVNAFLDPGEPSNVGYTTPCEYLCKSLISLIHLAASDQLRQSSFDIHHCLNLPNLPRTFIFKCKCNKPVLEEMMMAQSN